MVLDFEPDLALSVDRSVSSEKKELQTKTKHFQTHHKQTLTLELCVCINSSRASSSEKTDKGYDYNY